MWIYMQCSWVRAHHCYSIPSDDLFGLSISQCPGEENYQVLGHGGKVPTTGGCVVARCEHMHHDCHSNSICHLSLEHDALQVYKRAASPSIPTSVFESFHPHPSLTLFCAFPVIQPTIQSSNNADHLPKTSISLSSRCTLADMSSLWASSRLCPSPTPYRHLSGSSSNHAFQ